MIRFFTISLFILSAQLSFSQTKAAEASLSSKSAASNYTLAINVASMPLLSITNLHDEMIRWVEKIISINHDTVAQILYIEYNDLWDRKEIQEMYTKYGISGEQIISGKR